MRKRSSGSLWAAVPAAMLAALIALLSLSAPASTQERCVDFAYARDRVIVVMNEGASAESLERMKGLNGEGGESNFSQDAWSVDVPAGKTATEALALYQTLPGVEYSELDQIATPNQACPGTEASLEMAHAFQPDPVAVGEDFSYVAIVLNHGPARAENAGVWAGVSDGAKIVSASLVAGGDKGACLTDPTGSIQCSLDELEVGEVATMKVVVRPTRPGRLSVTSEPSADNSTAVFETTKYTTVQVPEHCTVADTTGSGVLEGTPGPDVICGFDGEDRISAGGGDDVVYGGVGNDTIFGGSGSDWLGGGEGDDTLRARDGMKRYVDRLRGGAGEDAILADSWDRVRRD